MKNIIDLIARAFLAFIFLYEAYDLFLHFHEAESKIDLFDVAWQREWILTASIGILIFGGILLLIGYRVKLAVILLLIYWIPVTIKVHGFWAIPMDCELTTTCFEEALNYRRWQSIMFMRNLAIIGGLLMVYVNGSGGYSVKRMFATTKVRKF